MPTRETERTRGNAGRDRGTWAYDSGELDETYFTYLSPNGLGLSRNFLLHHSSNNSRPFSDLSSSLTCPTWHLRQKRRPCAFPLAALLLALEQGYQESAWVLNSSAGMMSTTSLILSEAQKPAGHGGLIRIQVRTVYSLPCNKLTKS